MDFQPESRILRKTTHTSSYTYWFLDLSAKILTKCRLSGELQARHSYILHMIAVRLDELKVDEYLFHTASIYARNLSTSSVMRSSLFWSNFLHALNGRRGDFIKDNPSQLCKALKANEVGWAGIDQALKALEPSDTAVMSDSHGANDTKAPPSPLSRAHGQDPTLGERRESGGRTGDAVICMKAT